MAFWGWGPPRLDPNPNPSPNPNPNPNPNPTPSPSPTTLPLTLTRWAFLASTLAVLAARGKDEHAVPQVP